MIRVVEVKPCDNYRIWLRYEDGVEGEVDLSDLAGKGVFSAWLYRAFFETVKVDECGVVKWGDDIDLCPDALHLRLTGKQTEDLFPRLGAVKTDARD